MAETKIESKVTSSTSSAADVYAVVSNLENLKHVSELIPQDKVSDMEFGQDYVRFKVDGLGQKVCIRMVDMQENDYVKFAAEGIPMQLNFWIQMKQVAPEDTRLKLTFKGELPMFVQMMLGNKLQTGLDQAADMLAQMPFNQWNA